MPFIHKRCRVYLHIWATLIFYKYKILRNYQCLNMNTCKAFPRVQGGLFMRVRHATLSLDVLWYPSNFSKDTSANTWKAPVKKYAMVKKTKLKTDKKSLQWALAEATSASFVVRRIFWATSHGSGGMCQNGSQTGTLWTQQVPHPWGCFLTPPHNTHLQSCSELIAKNEFT